MKTDDGMLVEQEVFYLKGVLCLPHYTIPDAFVVPQKRSARPRYFNREQLINKGAMLGKLMLWPRRCNQ